jgi:hypothetical protein
MTRLRYGSRGAPRQERGYLVAGTGLVVWTPKEVKRLRALHHRAATQNPVLAGWTPTWNSELEDILRGGNVTGDH